MTIPNQMRAIAIVITVIAPAGMTECKSKMREFRHILNLIKRATLIHLS